ncbi:hypothetical protein [Kosakonia radicincitans]|uniref:hypothetical protein n=1 Tax=Kosakonia radicincitans TaxID=283686 RepID=UPI001D068860|nr:hypothetical protein [Kosakonia radicincitans]
MAIVEDEGGKVGPVHQFGDADNFLIIRYVFNATFFFDPISKIGIAYTSYLFTGLSAAGYLKSLFINLLNNFHLSVMPFSNVYAYSNSQKGATGGITLRERG